MGGAGLPVEPGGDSVGLERVRVVQDEAHLERDAVLAHLAAHVLGRDGERLCATTGPCRGGANRRVERDVGVAPSRDPGPRVLAAAQRDQRPVTAADRPALEAVGRQPLLEHATRVDVQLGDPRPALELV